MCGRLLFSFFVRWVVGCERGCFVGNPRLRRLRFAYWGSRRETREISATSGTRTYVPQGSVPLETLQTKQTCGSKTPTIYFSCFGVRTRPYTGRAVVTHHNA